MSTLIGHQRQIEYFNTVLQRGTLAHAYLLHGPEQIGKLTLAKTLAKFLYCTRSIKNLESVCDACPQCALIQNNIHPNVIILDREHTLVSKKETRKDIPIEDIRELKHRFAFAPERGMWRIVIIDEAEKLNQESANAFLKLLEEPGNQTLILLVTASIDLIPPTIISRTQPVQFSSVSDSALDALLTPRVKDAKVRKDIIALSMGKPGAALHLAEDKELYEKERKLLQQVHAMIEQKDFSSAYALTEKIAGDESQRDKAILYVLDTLRTKLSGDHPVAITSAIKKIHHIAMQLATTNVNPKLALDVLFLNAIV